MQGITIVLVLAALGLAGLGVLLLSEATAGVGVLALACVLGILARIFQASQQHRDLKAHLEAMERRARG